MVNYKRVVCEVAVLLLVVSATAAAPTSDNTHTLYDQRQNGTENYRWKVDGLVIAVAPHSFMDSASDLSDYFDLSSIDVLLKPSTETSPTKPEESLKPDHDKPLSDDHKKEKKYASVRKQENAQSLKQRLANAIIPLLQKIRRQ